MYDLEYLRQLHYEETLKSIVEKGYKTEYVAKQYIPGVFRPPMAENELRAKRRFVESKNIITIAIYSRMDEDTMQAADKMLKSINIDGLAKLSSEEFSCVTANLYADLDFCHPFVDGNSRTLRAFIAEIANESGFEVNWGRYDQSKQTHEQLYAARDVEVNSIALKSMHMGNYHRGLVEQSMRDLQDFKSLMQIFGEIIQIKSRSHENGRDGGVELD